MIKHGFMEKDIEPSAVADHIKELLVNENFKITSDETRDALWEIHSKKSDRERIVLGKVRDVDVVIAGAQGKFEVQLHAGICWGETWLYPRLKALLLLV
jgi:hypothetical protein